MPFFYSQEGVKAVSPDGAQLGHGPILGPSGTESEGQI